MFWGILVGKSFYFAVKETKNERKFSLYKLVRSNWYWLLLLNVGLWFVIVLNWFCIFKTPYQTFRIFKTSLRWRAFRTICFKSFLFCFFQRQCEFVPSDLNCKLISELKLWTDRERSESANQRVACESFCSTNQWISFENALQWTFHQILI